MRGILRGAIALTAIMAATSLQSVRAAERDFTLVTGQSNIAISGTVTNSTFGATAIQQQGAGGLTTSYSGTIKSDRGTGTISFLSGSMIDANTSGNWTPLADATAGSSPADYGAKAAYLGGLVTINFAGRNLLAGLAGSSTSVDDSGHFDLSTTDVIFTAGDLAYRGSAGTPAGTNSLANKSGALSGTASLSSTSQSGQTTETLTLPVNATFSFAADASNTISLTLTGQLVGTSTFATPLPGDYNQNGVVDAADYVLWRNNLGSGTSLPNDDTAGVGEDDYTRWRSHFGQTPGGGSSVAAAGSAVPEPCSAGLLLLAVAGLRFGWRGRSAQ